jgi:hypothetical protein
VKMVRMLIQVTRPLKAKLDALRKQGTTASGLIQNLLAYVTQLLNEPTGPTSGDPDAGKEED